MADLPNSKISDEAVEDHARAVFELENPVYVWDDCSESARLTYRAEARLHLAALVASGWRPGAELVDHRIALGNTIAALSLALECADADRFPADALDSCRHTLARAKETFWTGADRTTALEPAQPLPVAAGPDADDNAWAANQRRFYEDWQRAIDAGEAPDPRPSFSAGTPTTDQERSEEIEHG